MLNSWIAVCYSSIERYIYFYFKILFWQKSVNIEVLDKILSGSVMYLQKLY